MQIKGFFKVLWAYYLDLMKKYNILRTVKIASEEHCSTVELPEVIISKNILRKFIQIEMRSAMKEIINSVVVQKNRDFNSDKVYI